jgi:hypothetical protein
MQQAIVLIMLFDVLTNNTSGLGPLDAYLWKNRIIVISADNPKHPDYVKQQTLLAEHAFEFNDRDLVSFHLFRDEGYGPDGDPLGKESLIFLREQYDFDAHPFTILLIGKDGTVKRKSSAPLDQAVIYAQIDTMPMRKIEMQRRK